VRYGGPIRSVHALCRELAAAGHDVQVFTTSVDGPSDSDVPLMQPVELEGVKVTYFPSRILRRLYWSPPMRKALEASIAGFDAVHLHAVYLWPILAGARAARARDIPYVISPRGMLVPELIRRKSRWVKEAWIGLIERPNLEAAAAIHATSAVEAGHIASFGWRLPRIAMIPHGVDDPPPPSTEPLSADIAAAIAGGPMVLAFGRISWEKGLDRLIAALSRVPTVRAVIAGDDADGHATFLASEAMRLGVAQRVAILPRHVSGADKEALFAAARLFAMTSLSENFGIAAFEAMRRGLPVLATPDVGMSEIVRDTRCGCSWSTRRPLPYRPGCGRMFADPEFCRRQRRGGTPPRDRSLWLARHRPSDGGALSFACRCDATSNEGSGVTLLLRAEPVRSLRRSAALSSSRTGCPRISARSAST
jgi:glycosyltransferase involved in cell wall biosynthesis